MSRRARDIMIPLEKYPHIPHTYTILQAIEVMERAEVESRGKKSLPRSVIVFDEDYHPLGIVRRRDILRGLEPKFLRGMSHPQRKLMFEIEVDPDLVDMGGGRLARAVGEQAAHPVTEVMRNIRTTVNHDDIIAKIIYKMVHNDLDVIPVLKEDRVIGVVRSVDVFHEVADELLSDR
jgi:predicted transcriptional regulator